MLISILSEIKCYFIGNICGFFLAGLACLCVFHCIIHLVRNYSGAEQENQIMDQPVEIGDWRKISILGSGAFGTVMLWRNQKNSEFVAIKKCRFLKPNSLSAKQKERWCMEVDFLKSINHPNIISFKRLDVILEEALNKNNPTKLPLLSMEYCKKGNLRRYLTSEPIKLCGLPEHDVRCILEDISSGLNYLHTKKITHRDIKPDNIVLQHCDNRKGETVYKIIDLGYAKELQDATLSFVGTLHYLAPEIFYNQNYGHSVDYWSMGTMVFEIICGVLPFLPELTPFERFEKIKDKGADDICIYMSHSGAITNSTEIKKEHFITSCFKQNVESWLKRVLQMDPANRTFSNGLSAFDYLRFILDKKIVQVFSVHKQEFYSYEVNSSTLLGTLKEWISRDIKIPKQDLLFLFRAQNNVTGNERQNDLMLFSNDDNTLLEYFLSNDELILYVYKKDALFSDRVMNQKMPSLVKELFNFNSKFQVKFSKNIYRQTLFFVHSELRIQSELKNAYASLMYYINSLWEDIQNKYVMAKEEFGGLSSKIEQFLLKKRELKLSSNNNVDLSTHPELGECLKYFERLCSNAERRRANLKDFRKQYKILGLSKQGIEDAGSQIENIFEKCNIQSQFDKINGKGFLEKPDNGEPQDVILKRIKDVVDNTLKLKYNLFVKEKLKDYLKDIGTILNWTEQLVLWVNNFINNIQKLSQDFNDVQEKHDKIISDVLKSRKVEFILSYDVLDTKEIVRQNELLRCQFADLISQRVADHKSFVDVSLTYLDLE